MFNTCRVLRASSWKSIRDVSGVPDRRSLTECKQTLYGLLIEMFSNAKENMSYFRFRAMECFFCVFVVDELDFLIRMSCNVMLIEGMCFFY